MFLLLVYSTHMNEFYRFKPKTGIFALDREEPLLKKLHTLALTAITQF